MLIQERQKHKEIRQHFEAKISELQNQHASAIKQAELEKQLAEQSLLKYGPIGAITFADVRNVGQAQFDGVAPTLQFNTIV